MISVKVALFKPKEMPIFQRQHLADWIFRLDFDNVYHTWATCSRSRSNMTATACFLSARKGQISTGASLVEIKLQKF